MMLQISVTILLSIFLSSPVYHLHAQSLYYTDFYVTYIFIPEQCKLNTKNQISQKAARFFNSTLSEDQFEKATLNRDVFRTLSNICDCVFSRKQLTAFNRQLYLRKSLIIDVSHPACDVVATSHLGLKQVEMSQTIVKCHHDVATGA